MASAATSAERRHWRAVAGTLGVNWSNVDRVDEAMRVAMDTKYTKIGESGAPPSPRKGNVDQIEELKRLIERKR